MLHARTLGFQHPATGEEMDFAADPPEDFEDVFQSLSIDEETTSERAPPGGGSTFQP